MVAVLAAVSARPLKPVTVPIASVSLPPLAPLVETPPEPPRAAASPLLAQGLEAAQRGELADAEGFFRRAVEQDAGDAEAWNSLGVVLVRQGEPARGVEALRKALRLQPSHVEAHRNLGVALDRQGRTGEAAHHYRTFLSLATDAHPGRGDVRRRLLVRPGMTGLWQVSGRSELSWDDAVRLDLYYVDNWSMVQDLNILARTVSAVLSSRGAY